jgi:hypothetical protein
LGAKIYLPSQGRLTAGNVDFLESETKKPTSMSIYKGKAMSGKN